MWAIWQAIMGFIGGPVIKGLLEAYNAKLQATNTSEKTAADLAAAEIAAQTAEVQEQTKYRIAEIGHWYEPDNLMGYLAVFLLGKLIIWDIILDLGTTNLHQGLVTGTVNLIVAFYFGKRGFENIAKIIKGGRK